MWLKKRLSPRQQRSRRALKPSLKQSNIPNIAFHRQMLAHRVRQIEEESKSSPYNNTKYRSKQQKFGKIIDGVVDRMDVSLADTSFDIMLDRIKNSKENNHRDSKIDIMSVTSDVTLKTSNKSFDSQSGKFINLQSLTDEADKRKTSKSTKYADVDDEEVTAKFNSFLHWANSCAADSIARTAIVCGAVSESLFQPRKSRAERLNRRSESSRREQNNFNVFEENMLTTQNNATGEGSIYSF